MRLHFLPLLLTAAAATTTATPLAEPPKRPKQHPEQVNTPKTKIDLSGFPVKMVECFARYRPTTTQAQWCTMSIAEIHAWCQKTWFNCVCKHPADKHHVWPRQEMEAYITAFNGWMDATCGFHTITNTGMPLLDMCGVF